MSTNFPCSEIQYPGHSPELSFIKTDAPGGKQLFPCILSLNSANMENVANFDKLIDTLFTGGTAPTPLLEIDEDLMRYLDSNKLKPHSSETHSGR